MEKKNLLVRCDKCNKQWEVLKRTSERLQALVLDFAVCPHCEEPRNKFLQKKHENDEKCLICHIPKKKLSYCGGARGLCGRCYVIVRLSGKRKKYPCVSKGMAKLYD